MTKPYQLAREAFDKDNIAKIQEDLARWQNRNFSGVTLEQIALGVCEEAGELAHAVLKHKQGIRGLEDSEEFRAKAADACADVMIFAIQMCTVLRCDFWTLLEETAFQVMQREWKKEPKLKPCPSISPDGSSCIKFGDHEHHLDAMKNGWDKTVEAK